MPRPTYPHTIHDVVRAVDGPMGLVVGELPDGSIWVLKRNRRTPGFVLTHYRDERRSATLAERAIADRDEAIAAMCRAIGLGDDL